MHNSAEWLRGNGFGEAALLMQSRGYQYDYISDRLLDGVKVATDGMLQAGKGTWRTLVVPKSRFMPPATMEKILALARNGATVIFVGAPPADAPGFKDFVARRAKLVKLEQDAGLTGKAAASGEVKLGKGKALIGGDLDLLLTRAGARRERITDNGAKFIREKLPDGYVYFISNFGREQIKDMVRFATPAKSAVIFDPLTGAAGVASMRIAGARNSDIFVQLLPGQSLILRTYEKETVRDAAWPYYEPFGAAYSISTHWKVEFTEGGPELPPPAYLEQLSSWTDFGGKGAKYFSGTARYTKEFILPEIPAQEWMIDFGRVAESARVKLNGHDLGILWSGPFVARIAPGIMKPAGEVNRLEVEVTNLMANRVIQLDKKMSPWKIFYDINVVDIGYKPFDASKWEPLESGLIGPVVLIPVFDPMVAEKK